MSGSVDRLAMRVACAPAWWRRGISAKPTITPVDDRIQSVSTAQSSLKDRISKIESGLAELSGKVDGMPIVGHPYRIADQADSDIQVKKLGADIRMIYQEMIMRIEFLEAEVRHLKP